MCKSAELQKKIKETKEMTKPAKQLLIFMLMKKKNTTIYLPKKHENLSKEIHAWISGDQEDRISVDLKSNSVLITLANGRQTSIISWNREKRKIKKIAA